ncbi:dipeptidase [Paracoccus sp. P2]|uniref:Dipeptidase n=1 Tax=Paracoccus pantotrophus TaxID=82367 RepID=A0A1I5C4Y1_PARPN|nr:dipeptidase [Paracoccus pantotrophus]MDF3853033.1 dipeptidase [Paracoccus pantotrophus]QFG35610.1 peptidase M19 [Paracoccus pantotrophus]QLH13880.1 dipeptidase [Paracoccus pantotrophus]RDE01073.1 peptidase M19 [Paracoccus pantotrophus]RKS44153.1 microsomal dipeptidase-like Zn-dependent dipeptidase [Paracoccus pantotrophus]
MIRMIRRIILWLSVLAVLAAAVVAIWGPGFVERRLNPVTMPAEGWPVSPQAEALHQRLVIGDWHSDALLWDRDLLRHAERGHTDIPRLVQGNVAVQVFTTVTKSPRGQNYGRNSAEAPDNITPLFIGQLRPLPSWFSLKERALVQAAALRHAAQRAPDQLMLIRSAEDLQTLLEARQNGAQTVGAILGAEGAHPLEGQIGNLQVLYGAGFRLLGLTHFFDNELGGSLHGEGGSGAGLSPFGRQVVEEMMAKRMIIDLAHASPQMVRDVLAIPGTRPILSHTGIHGHCPSPRNLDDALLRAIADKGGLIGIGYWADVVCGKTPADIAGSIQAAIALVGEDHVSLGSDYDGSVDAPFDAAHLAALTQALLDAGLSDQQIAKVMGGNMMRYLAQML